MQFTWITILFLSIGSLFLEARIGETVEELQSRHGAGKEIGDNQIIFTIENFDVTISFEKGKSIREIYTTRVGNNNEVQPMNEKEVQRLLKIQCEGKSWQKVEEESDGRTLWLMAEGTLYARFLPKFNTLTFTAALKDRSRNR